MTGIYTFRMIFRAFWGEPCEEARELEHGHLVHHEVPTNPQTGEAEDIDVGFPGEEHHIAERDWQMRFAMSALAFLAVVGGLIQIPGVDDAISKFLAPTFANSPLYDLHASTATEWVGLIIGALIAVAGISIAYRTWVLKPGTSAALQARLSGLHTFLYNKWYFDELIDMLIVRPTQWLGRFTDSALEHGVIAGGITGGTTGIVRAASAAVRRAQTGYLRYYAAVIVVGISGMALYFLISAS